MKLLSHRTVSFAAFLLCVVLIASSFYLELHLKLEPCPLCIIQRLLIIILAFFFLFGSFFKFQKRNTLYYSFVFFISVFGIAVAGRQVYLTMLPPDQVPSCGASISYLLEILPVTQAIQLIFQGTGECAKVTWRFLSLSLPAWSLIFFILFALVALWQIFRKVN